MWCTSGARRPRCLLWFWRCIWGAMQGNFFFIVIDNSWHSLPAALISTVKGPWSAYYGVYGKWEEIFSGFFEQLWEKAVVKYNWWKIQGPRFPADRYQGANHPSLWCGNPPEHVLCIKISPYLGKINIASNVGLFLNRVLLGLPRMISSFRLSNSRNWTSITIHIQVYCSAWYVCKVCNV